MYNLEEVFNEAQEQYKAKAKEFVTKTPESTLPEDLNAKVSSAPSLEELQNLVNNIK